MAALIFNNAVGRFVEFQRRVDGNDPANSAFVIVLLQLAEDNDVLRDYNDLATLLAASGNTEADFTNGATPYVRKVLTDGDVGPPTVDAANNRVDVDLPDQIYADAGGSVDNSLRKALVCYDPDAIASVDANIVPCALYDMFLSTNGFDLTVAFNADGWARAQAA
jgi:hypothetical protein